MNRNPVANATKTIHLNSSKLSSKCSIPAAKKAQSRELKTPRELTPYNPRLPSGYAKGLERAESISFSLASRARKIAGAQFIIELIVQSTATPQGQNFNYVEPFSGR
jgi:hypothetical protein